jgi:hypothetical protein
VDAVSLPSFSGLSFFFMADFVRLTWRAGAATGEGDWTLFRFTAVSSDGEDMATECFVD